MIDMESQSQAMRLRGFGNSRLRPMLAIASFIMCAVHRCFPACIDRKPVLSVVADLVNSETSSQARKRRCWPNEFR